jgi:hypothetical protein
MLAACRIPMIVMLAGVLSGCAGSPPNPITQRRIQNLNSTLKGIEASEQRRPQLLNRTLDDIGQSYQDDVKQTAQNAVALDHLVEEEFRNWEEKQPMYDRLLQELFSGNLQNLEYTWNSMVN